MTDYRSAAPEWKKQLAYELLKPAPKRFARRPVFSPNVDSIWTGDLADFKRYADVNEDYKYILVVVDVFSRFAWARPLKLKNAHTTCAALESIFSKGESCDRFWSDRGDEFFNKNVQKLFKEKKVSIYSTQNEPKAMIAERFIRTLRRRIEESFILTDSTVWYNILQNIIDEYNNSPHTHLHGMTPIEARQPKNFNFVYRCQFETKFSQKDRLPRFSVGQKVRISLHKQLFEKGSTASWTEEIFQIRKLVFSDRVLYKLEDLSGEHLKGSYYPEQLQATNQSIYRVDKILKRRTVRGKAQVFVKWAGYPDKFNSWEPADAILHSQL